jgi:predicted HTH domain antitoxin
VEIDKISLEGSEKMKLLEINNENDQLNLKGLVGAGLYRSEDEVIHDALNRLLKDNPEYRLKLAIYRYQTEDISLGKAAEIAGLYWEDMRDILIRNGIKPELGPESIEEVQKDYLTIRNFLNERNCK